MFLNMHNGYGIMRLHLNVVELLIIIMIGRRDEMENNCCYECIHCIEGEEREICRINGEAINDLDEDIGCSEWVSSIKHPSSPSSSRPKVKRTIGNHSVLDNFCTYCSCEREYDGEIFYINHEQNGVQGCAAALTCDKCREEYTLYWLSSVSEVVAEGWQDCPITHSCCDLWHAGAKE